MLLMRCTCAGGRCGFASDIFSLGIVLYELATQARPCPSIGHAVLTHVQTL